MDYKGILITLIILAIAGCVQQKTTPTADAPVADTPETGPTSISLSDVALHNTVSDCWLAINNKVYDVTEFVSSHPGGQAIVQGCGTDATTLFETRPMGSETPHSDNARDKLPGYYIGELE